MYFNAGSLLYILISYFKGIRIGSEFDESCQATVPIAIIALLESVDFESAVRLAISVGGDSDTIACMAGGIVQAFYGKIPEVIINKVNFILDMQLKRVLREFNEKFKLEY